MEAKKALRRLLLRARSELTEAQLHAAHRALLRHLSELITQLKPAIAAAYVPFGTEPGGPGLPSVVESLVPEVLFPVLLPDRDLDWRLGDQTIGVGAIRNADLIIVPALAIDLRGYRLGRGGGSYDRALARAGPGATIVALSHEGELLPQVPHEPHDRRVHVALTPSGPVELDR